MRGVMGSHVLQNVGRRLKRLLAHFVHADRVPAVFTRHKGAACNTSASCVHNSRLRFIHGGVLGDIGTVPSSPHNRKRPHSLSRDARRSVLPRKLVTTSLGSDRGWRNGPS
jgi:hypothetical protein